jgi:hypothetical protein
MCGAAHINSPNGEKPRQLLFRGRHGRYLERVLAAAHGLKVARDAIVCFLWSALHHDHRFVDRR